MDIPVSSAYLAQSINVNQYQLVALLSKRAKELMFGAKPLIENSTDNYVQIAMQELLAGKIKPRKK